jgi:hypothetical protein
MKQIFIFVILFSTVTFAQSKWSDLEKNKKYSTNRAITLEKEGYKLELPKNSKIELVEAMSLPMIKVELLKFDISEFCNDGESISDIKLIDIKQSSGLIVTVGADLAEDCVMEMFVETKDVYTNSIFK